MQTNKISNDDFTKLVTQANLVLTQSEQQKIHSQLDETLGAVKVMNELDTQNIAQTSSASGLTNITRDDVVTPSLTQTQTLSNAARTHQGYFVVPAIFEAQDN